MSSEYTGLILGPRKEKKVSVLKMISVLTREKSGAGEDIF